uniref:CDP-diacylglycerol--inositol 3-phosphatidyltransferase n=1 Tax=Taeniopygia guttata TaxID=59729 RepID=A0A674HQV7_TAEGU
MGEENVFLFVPNLIGYARILLAAVSFGLMPTRPWPAAVCYGTAALLDAVDGHAARALGQGSRLGAMLDMLTDRLSSMCLLLNLALLYPRWAPLFQLSSALDLASHWLHTHCSALQGAASHKAVGGEGHPLLRRYYQCRVRPGTGLYWEGTGGDWGGLGGTGRDWEGTGTNWEGTGGNWEGTGGDWEGTGLYWEGLGGTGRELGGTGSDWDKLGGTGRELGGTGGNWEQTGRDWEGTGPVLGRTRMNWEGLGRTGMNWEGTGRNWEGTGTYWDELG